MKTKLLLLLTLTLCISKINAQCTDTDYINIPDANFKNY